MAVRQSHDGVVDRQQRRGADQPAGDRVVLADDRVLHRVRNRQQHDEIERIELRQLALPGEPQHHDEKRVDDDGPKHFFRDRQRQKKHVVEQRQLHAAIVRW